MARKKKTKLAVTRRSYPADFKRDAVQIMLDGYTAAEVCERLGISNTNILYRTQTGTQTGTPKFV